MAQLTRLRLLTLLTSLIALGLGGDVPGLAGRFAASGIHARDPVWVAHGHQSMKVRITGTVDSELSPGVSVPIELGLANPFPHALDLGRVKVSIVSITAPHADARHQCTATDFGLRQMRRGILRLPAQRYVDLGDLGVPMEDWPQIMMNDRPVNQDGCKGASLTLRYRAHQARRPTT